MSRLGGGFFRDYDDSLLKNGTVVRIALTVLVLFFMLQLLSHIFFSIGRSKEEAGSDFLKLSALLSPMEAKPLLEYGYVLLEESEDATGTLLLEKSIHHIKKAIGSNMLYYNGYLYLGKAYLAQKSSDFTGFSMAVATFKRAALIRWNDPQVSMNTLTLLLSLWPHLTAADRSFTSQLLGKRIKKIKNEDFHTLVDTWALYCRDVELFREILQKRPRFYRDVARKLGRLEIEMAARQEFLTKYAVFSLVRLKERYQELRLAQGPDLLRDFKAILKNLESQIAGYLFFAPVNKAERESSSEFKKQLKLDILELLFARQDWKKGPRQLAALEDFVLSFVNDISSVSEINDFSDFLNREKYFDLKAANIRVFYIEQMLDFKSGRYDAVIEDTEKYIKSIVVVKEEHLKAYTDVLLLLTDAYISSRLLTRALDVLAEINRSKVTGPEFYWRVKQIEQVIGPEDAGEDKDKEQQLALITGSRFIELASLRLRKTVYLNDKKNLEIVFADTLYEKEKMKSAHLLQVFIDEELLYEGYLSKLEFPVSVTAPSERRFSRHDVLIKII
ncbi:MAG: hypothetical protein KAW12_20275 [Candidatus Aminicenantes bacterium]|nr:hypothetical protein [Candidatus Aminicenantes bacterium]